jgi:hypothetical protein
MVTSQHRQSEKIFSLNVHGRVRYIENRTKVQNEKREKYLDPNKLNNLNVQFLKELPIIGQSPASYRGGPGSVPGLSLWDLCWIKLHSD